MKNTYFPKYFLLIREMSLNAGLFSVGISFLSGTVSL